jgi:hypothetical protein
MTYKIIEQISKISGVRMDTILKNTLKFTNEELKEIVNQEYNNMMNSYIFDIKTESDKIIRIYFQKIRTNGTFRKSYITIKNFNIFYL